MGAVNGDGGGEGGVRGDDCDAPCVGVLERLSLEEIGRVATSFVKLRSRCTQPRRTSRSRSYLLGAGQGWSAEGGGVEEAVGGRMGGEDPGDDEGGGEMGWRGTVREDGISLSLSLSLALSRSRPLYLSLSLALSRALYLSLSLSLSLSRARALSLTHTLTLTHSLPPSLPPSL
jgi:hypothetical protein